MKATIDIPDALYRQVKSRSALEGRAIRDVTIELYERWLAEAPAPSGAERGGTSADADTWLASWQALGADIADAAVDERTTRDILVGDRR